VNIHKNAKTTPKMRALIVERRQAGETPGQIASALGVSSVTVRKWIARHAAEGRAGLEDRSSRPHQVQTRTSDDHRAKVAALRRQRQSFWKIATSVGLSRATVARIAKACGLSHLSALDPKPEIIRYEKDTPGEMIHIDIKRLGRINGIGHRITGDRTGQSNARARKDGGKGWGYLHLAVDDHSRLAYCEIFPDETRKSCLTFLFNALRFLRNHGVRVWRVMTDNGVSFRSKRYAKALRMLKIKHKRTKPYTPKTNGKAERFVQTSLREWAYATPYAHSDHRRDALEPFLEHYNTHRPHFGLNGKTPISRILSNNLLRHDT
jgi:transposase